MDKKSDDLRSYLASLFDADAQQEQQSSDATQAELPVQAESSAQPEPPAQAAQSAEATSYETLTSEELFRQGAQAAQEQRRQREAQMRQEQAKEADAWLRDSVRDESSDSAQGFDFLDDDEEFEAPPPDEWPAFVDIDGNADVQDSADTGVKNDQRTRGDGQAREKSSSALGRFFGRVLSTIVVLVLVAGAVYGITHGRTQSQNVDAPLFQGPPAPAQLACAGTFERSIEVGMSVEEVDEGVSDTALLLATGAADNGKTQVKAPSGKNAVGLVSAAQAEGLFAAEDNSTALAGLNFHRAQAGDMRGIAGVACVSGQADAYLVGSEMSVGTSSELVLVNLSPTPATVHLDALGSAGSLKASSIENIVVDAQSVKRVTLDGAIEGDKRLALHISAPTGAVAAFVQETALEGAKPAGVTWISPSSSASRLVIPAVSIPFDSVDFPRVRLANFEDKPATVSVVLRSEERAFKRKDLSNIEVAPHSVLDIPLDGIDGGMYSALVTSDIPVSAGVELVYRQSEDAAREIAWAGAVRPTHEAVGVFGEMPATLVVAGQEAGKATVSLYGKDGKLLEKSKLGISDTRSAVLDIPAEAVAVQVSADVPISGGIFGQMPLDDGGMAVDWLPLVSRTDDIGKQRISFR